MIYKKKKNTLDRILMIILLNYLSSCNIFDPLVHITCITSVYFFERFFSFTAQVLVTASYSSNIIKDSARDNNEQQ